MSEKNHILILTPGFPDDEDDYITIPPLQEFLKKFISTYPDQKVTVFTFQYPYQLKKYIWNGISVISFAGKNKSATKPLLWMRIIKQAKLINKKDSVTVIHSLWLGECALIGNYLSKKLGCKNICTLMGQDVKQSNKYLRFLKNKDINIVALSANQSDQFFNITNRNVDEIIHWGIEDNQLRNTKRDIDLLAVGSLIPLKNYSLLIKAVEKIVKGKPDIKCLLAGSGPEESFLRKEAKEKGIENNIIFTGTLNREEIFKLMQRSKIFIHPSKFEGSGYVFAEALVNGMNIVSFNVGYAQTHPKWFVAKNEDEFINSINKLLESELDFAPVNLFPLNETVSRYAALYKIEQS